MKRANNWLGSVGKSIIEFFTEFIIDVILKFIIELIIKVIVAIVKCLTD